MNTYRFIKILIVVACFNVLATAPPVGCQCDPDDYQVQPIGTFPDQASADLAWQVCIADPTNSCDESIPADTNLFLIVLAGIGYVAYVNRSKFIKSVFW